MTTARKPPTPPAPLKVAKYSAKPNPDRPQLARLMGLITEIIDGSEGKITRRSLGEDIGRSPQEVAEWLSCKRYAPNGETTILMIKWAAKHDRAFLKALIS